MKLPEKFNSDRLWAIVAYGLLLIANARFAFGIEPEAMTELSYVVIAFVLGKSIRGTGTALAALLPGVLKTQGEPVIEPNDILGQLQDQLTKKIAEGQTQPPAVPRGE